MKTNVSTKISQCIACPIAHQVISDYLTFYNDYLEYQKSNNLYDEDFKVVVQGISETLNFQGSFEEQLDFVLNLSKAKLNEKGLNEENFECVKTIHKILKSIKPFFYSQTGDYEFFIEDCQKQTIEVVSEIQNLLNDKAVDIEEEWLTIKKLKKRHKQESDDECGNECIEKYTEYKELLEDYCVNSYNEIPYEYSNSYGRDYRNCQCENFLEYVKKINKPAIVDFDYEYERIDKLKAEYQNIVYDFISKTSKHFGQLFRRIVKIQDLTDTEIRLLLWNDPDKAPSSIDSLIKSAEPELSIEQLKRLSRILLISEDVLKCGTGISYGFWKSTDTLDEISKIVRLSNSDFIDKLKEKNIYEEKEICVYPKEDENTKEIYIDYETMYYTALHPEEIDVLISVLEELQAQENN